MAKFVFDDFARTTLGGAYNAHDKSPLSAQQVDEIIEFLKSPGSGPDATTSFSGYLEAEMEAHPPKLKPGMAYVGYSGKDSSGLDNFEHAKRHVEARPGEAGMIGNTPWGERIEHTRTHALQHPEFLAMEDRLRGFLDLKGIQPYDENCAGALRDMMWNAGSPKYFENAIASGRPIIAYVENAPAWRGFATYELTTALDYPAARVNGYPVSDFGVDPLAFSSRSAGNYLELERKLAEAATVHADKPVTLKQISQMVNPIDGYEPHHNRLYGRQVTEFGSLSLNEMVATRTSWLEAGNSLNFVAHLKPEAPEPKLRTPGEPGSARGSPNIGATAAEVASESAPHPHPARASVNPALKAGGIAGLALLAHDFGTSGHKWIELHKQGNDAGAYSTAAHFVGRNVGGAFGGFVAGAGVGLTTGSWTGPGAIITGIGGGALGAYLGERWADQKDIDHIYKQEDPLGRTWTRSPGDPEGRWLRGAHQEQVQGSDLGTGPEVRTVQTALGDDVTFRADYVATGTLERQLNWQAARASYELGLNNPPAPKDPYRLSAANMDGPRGAFESGRDFVRDPRSEQWEVEIRQTIDGRAATTRREPVSAEQALALDEQSRTVIAQNAANTPAAMAARYMVAYEQGRWSDFGDKDNPSIPTAIQKARDGADTLVASDGDKYTRQADGQWIHNGTFLDAPANSSVRQELESTWKSQQAGVEELGAIAAEARATTRIPNEGVRGQVDALYAKYGIERTEEQLAATATAVEQSMGSEGKLTDVTLELVPDAHTRKPSVDSAIAAFSDPGNNVLELRGTTTPQDVARVLAEQSLHKPDTTPLPDSPEKRIDALSPEQWDAHQQALREANRQGASTEDAIQAATLAAQQAGPSRPVPAQEPQREAEPQRTPVGQDPEPVTPQAAAVAMAAAQATAVPAAAAISAAATQVEQSRNPPQPSTQEQARAEQEGTRQDEARATQRDASTQQAEARREPPVSEPKPAQPAADAARVQETQAATPVQPTMASPAQPVQETPATAQPLPEEAQRAPEPMRPQPESVDAASVEQQAREEALREPVRPMEDRTRDVAPDRPIEHTSEPITFTPEAEASREQHRFEQPATPTPAPPQASALSDPRDPDHPDHRLYQQVSEHVARLDASHGRQHDEISERLTGSLMVLAKSNGLSSVDNVLLSNATPNAKAGEHVFVVQGELNNPGHQRAVMQTEQAVTTPLEQSHQKLEELAKQDQAQEQALAVQQREENERTQRESNPSMRA